MPKIHFQMECVFSPQKNLKMEMGIFGNKMEFYRLALSRYLEENFSRPIWSECFGYLLLDVNRSQVRSLSKLKIDATAFIGRSEHNIFQNKSQPPPPPFASRFSENKASENRNRFEIDGKFNTIVIPPLFWRKDVCRNSKVLFSNSPAHDNTTGARLASKKHSSTNKVLFDMPPNAEKEND